MSLTNAEINALKYSPEARTARVWGEHYARQDAVLYRDREDIDMFLAASVRRFWDPINAARSEADLAIADIEINAYQRVWRQAYLSVE